MKWRPRNEYVLVKVVLIGINEAGLVLPQQSIESKEFHVIGLGKEVKDLKVGDKVQMLGKEFINYWPVPGTKDQVVLKQSDVILVAQREDE